MEPTDLHRLMYTFRHGAPIGSTGRWGRKTVLRGSSMTNAGGGASALLTRAGPTIRPIEHRSSSTSTAREAVKIQPSSDPPDPYVCVTSSNLSTAPPHEPLGPMRSPQPMGSLRLMGRFAPSDRRRPGVMACGIVAGRRPRWDCRHPCRRHEWVRRSPCGIAAASVAAAHGIAGAHEAAEAHGLGRFRVAVWST